MSVSQPGLAVITVQFKVGVPRTEALVRLYDTSTRTPTGCRAGSGVLRADHQAQGHRRRADRHADAVQRGPATRRLRPGAGRAQHRGRPEARAGHARSGDDRRPGPRACTVEIDPARLAGAGVDRARPARRAAVRQPRAAGRRTARRQPRGRGRGRRRSCAMPRDVGELVVGVRDGKPVFLQRRGDGRRRRRCRRARYVWHGGRRQGRRPQRISRR